MWGLALILPVLFVLLFVGQTINRFPRDILILREHYQDKNWTEFNVHLVVAGAFWLGSIILVAFFIVPLLGYEIKGWTIIVNFFRVFGR